MTDPTLAALHAAILAHPAEDTPRLAYADRLDELGDGAAAIRARFIRRKVGGLSANVPLTVLLELEPVIGDNPHHFLANSGSAARAEVHYPDWRFSYDRGFLSEVHCPAAAWLEHGPALVREHPVEVVRLVDAQIEEVSGLREWFVRGYSVVLVGTSAGLAVRDTPTAPFHVPGRFPSAAAALDALSAAAIAWAKNPAPPRPASATGARVWDAEPVRDDPDPPNSLYQRAAPGWRLTLIDADPTLHRPGDRIGPVYARVRAGDASIRPGEALSFPAAVVEDVRQEASFGDRGVWRCHYSARATAPPRPHRPEDTIAEILRQSSL